MPLTVRLKGWWSKYLRDHDGRLVGDGNGRVGVSSSPHHQMCGIPGSDGDVVATHMNKEDMEMAQELAEHFREAAQEVDKRVRVQGYFEEPAAKEHRSVAEK